MKCLVTGATGFLGKRLLELLLDDPAVSSVHVFSRSKTSHPNPKVRVHAWDLLSPIEGAPFTAEIEDVDCVFHLAGLYDFSADFKDSYCNNVLPTLNLIDWIHTNRPDSPPRIFYASTYAVGAGSEGPLAEAPLEKLPPVTRPYAHTKALAERALTDSGLPVQVFRLGILVGDSRTGAFEKFDGPYALLRFLSRLPRVKSGTRISKLFRSLPIPADPDGVQPFVPVDAAASLFHQAMSRSERSGFYGVYEPKSVLMGDFIQEAFDELAPGFSPRFTDLGFVSKTVRSALLRAQKNLTGMPAETIRFSLNPLPLESKRMNEVFGQGSVPAFGSYRSAFFKGFKSSLTGETSGEDRG